MNNLLELQSASKSYYFIEIQPTPIDTNNDWRVEGFRWLASQGNLGVVIGLLILFGWSINIKGLSQSAITGFNSLNVLSDRVKNLIDFVDKKDRELDNRHDETMHELERIKDLIKDINQKINPRK